MKGSKLIDGFSVMKIPQSSQNQRRHYTRYVKSSFTVRWCRCRPVA